jgi:hypothetical protein
MGARGGFLAYYLNVSSKVRFIRLESTFWFARQLHSVSRTSSKYAMKRIAWQKRTTLAGNEALEAETREAQEGKLTDLQFAQSSQ